MRSSFALIDLDIISDNVARIKQHVAPAQVMAVVKANGYGHGGLAVARAALNAGASSLGVALPQEGEMLRRQGITAPILVFGGFFVDEIPQFLDNDLALTLYDFATLGPLESACKDREQTARVHIKIDTGMGRVGVGMDGAVDLVRRVHDCSHLEIAGIYTHFATSDEADPAFAQVQLQRFLDVISAVADLGIAIPLRHAANSGAILNLPDAHLDMVRVGILLYGYMPAPDMDRRLGVRAALQLKSRIIHLYEAKPGDGVSYGRTFVARQRTRIATVPVGYADGYNRLLSNTARVLVGKKAYPVVGRVCMDQIMIDVGPDSAAGVGDEVTLLGPDAPVHMEGFCQTLKTIPYEICTGISERMPRVYQQEKDLADT